MEKEEKKLLWFYFDEDLAGWNWLIDGYDLGYDLSSQFLKYDSKLEGSVQFSEFHKAGFIWYEILVLWVKSRVSARAKLELDSLVFWPKIEYSSLTSQARRASSFSHIMEIILVAHKKNLNFRKLSNFNKYWIEGLWKNVKAC